MMQQDIPREKKALHALMADAIVAGYFEEGRWIPVTFGEYVELVWDTGAPPAYLKPAEGFIGILVMVAAPGLPLPDIAVPKFMPGIVPEIRRKG
jgi:hypothetical protein